MKATTCIVVCALVACLVAAVLGLLLKAPKAAAAMVRGGQAE